MKHLKRSKQVYLVTTAQNFLKSAKLCLMVSDDNIDRCDTKTELKFSCSDCKVQQTITTKRISIEAETDDLSVCAVHRPDCDFLINRIVVSWKVCTADQPVHCLNQSPPNYILSKPTGNYEECSSNSDCGTGETCTFLGRSAGRIGPYFGCGGKY